MTLRLWHECLGCFSECDGCPVIDEKVGEVMSRIDQIGQNGGDGLHYDVDTLTPTKTTGVETPFPGNILGPEVYKPITKNPCLDLPSGGSSPSQYGIPNGSIDLQDLIEYRGMSFSLGNIFKACYRYGHKNDNLYELNKMKWFIDRLIAEEER